MINDLVMLFTPYASPPFSGSRAGVSYTLAYVYYCARSAPQILREWVQFLALLASPGSSIVATTNIIVLIWKNKYIYILY